LPEAKKYMMRATDFEFRNRWWIFSLIFGLPFLLLLVDNVPVGSRIADRLAADVPMEVFDALHIVYGVAALLMLAAVFFRMWGAAYLGQEVVHDHMVRSEALHADGPYRHMRNPLYFGNILMAWAMALFLPMIGWPIVVIAVPFFCYRLIGREEAALAAQQGENYQAFLNAVPRLLPSVLARIPATGHKADWISASGAEAFFISFFLGVAGFAITIDIHAFYAGFVASPILGWLARLLTRKRVSSAAH
jgi:protein-S-isoprenylcysteine O-methyltransferase Ste14